MPQPVTSTAQQQTGEKPTVAWLPRNTPSERKRKGRNVKKKALQACQGIAGKPELRNYVEIEIWTGFHVSEVGGRKHVTARVKIAEQKASNLHQTLHVYWEGDYEIFSEMNYDSKRTKCTKEKRRRFNKGC